MGLAGTWEFDVKADIEVCEKLCRKKGEVGKKGRIVLENQLLGP